MGEWYFVWCLVSVQDWPSFDMWPWPLTLTPIGQGHQPVTTGGKSANVTLSSLPMSVPFTLWIERLTLTHFWVIQGQHFCNRNLFPISMSALSLCGKKFDHWPWPIFGSFKVNTFVTVYPKSLRMWFSSDGLSDVKHQFWTPLWPSPRTQTRNSETFLHMYRTLPYRS